MRIVRRLITATVILAGLVLGMPAIAGAASADGSSAALGVHGIDVSNNNGWINWPDVPASGAAWMYAKATEGTWFVDGYYQRNVIGAVQAGLPTGAYDFARPSTNPEADAQFFVDHAFVLYVGVGQLPPMLDLESTDGRDAWGVVDWATRWMNEVQRLTGRRPILYVGAYFLPGDALAALAGTGSDLMLPSYTAYGVTNPNPAWIGSPRVPDGWPGWSIWQYSSETTVSGIAGFVDANIATPSWFQWVTGIGTAPAPVPPDQQTVDAPWQVYLLWSRGAGVLARQQFLNAAGCDAGPEDGVWGYQTVAATECWQMRLGFTGGDVDGIWGVATEQATDAIDWAALANPAPDPFPIITPPAPDPTTSTVPAPEPTTTPPTGPPVTVPSWITELIRQVLGILTRLLAGLVS